MNQDLEHLTLDDEPDTRLGEGMLSFTDGPALHSQASALIKSWAHVQRGSIVVKTKMDEPDVKTTVIVPTLKIEVVHARTIDQENEKKHVAYTVMLRKDGLKPDPNPAVIERRYTDFLELYDSLRRENALLMTSIVFPKKVLIGNFDPSLISERSSGFEELLKHVAADDKLRNSKSFTKFLQCYEHNEARKWLGMKRYDQAIPLLENTFRLFNKLHTDRHPEVMVALCRLVACCNADPLATSAERFAELALRRYEAVSDVDLLRFYVPLLQLCVHLWWKLGKDKQPLEARLSDLKRRGINVDGCPPLLDALMKEGLL